MEIVILMKKRKWNAMDIENTKKNNRINIYEIDDNDIIMKMYYINEWYRNGERNVESRYSLKRWL